MTTPKTLNRFKRQRLISCNVLCECHNSSVDLRTFTVEKMEKERRWIWCLAPQSPRSDWHHFQSHLTSHRKSMTASISSRIVEEVTLQGHRWRWRDRLLADHPTMERQEAGSFTLHNHPKHWSRAVNLSHRSSSYQLWETDRVVPSKPSSLTSHKLPRKWEVLT